VTAFVIWKMASNKLWPAPERYYNNRLALRHPSVSRRFDVPGFFPRALIPPNSRIARRRWRNGTTHVIFEPLELIEKLGALVPAPRFNLIRYSGVLAPSASWRPHVIPPEPSGDFNSHPGCRGKKCSIGQTQNNMACRPRRYAWAELLKRVFSVDILKCDRCGERMRILCAINSASAIQKILDCLGLPSKPPLCP
jgi:hypothetical protein